MSKRLTTQEFIERAREVHSDKFDYSRVVYKNNKTKVLIGCPNGHWFSQTPNNHLSGYSCPYCAGVNPGTTETFIEKATSIHGPDKFDYSKVVYKNNKTKILVGCSNGHWFEQKPNTHLSGYGCPYCANVKPYTTKTFIEKAISVHGSDKFDYSKVSYKNTNTKVFIGCSNGHWFWQNPNAHLQGQGCPYCAGRNMGGTIGFIKKATAVHGSDKFDYSKVIYKRSNIKVLIGCSNGHWFKQKPNDHLTGYGCPYCNESKGEKVIAALLEKLKISYRREYKFDDCRNDRPLPFDFYLPTYHALIEYDGEQHFIAKGYFGGRIGLKTRQKYDSLKNAYAAANNIPLLRIPYWDFEHIEQLITDWLASLK